MSEKKCFCRRDFMRVAGAAAVCGGLAVRTERSSAESMRWQIDPAKCVQCGRCATNCVLNPSAVKCVHSFQICGYCDLCGGYLQPGAKARNTGAENQLCPTAALQRKFIEVPYFQYSIDEAACVGCGKCVKGCSMFGNGSLYLQVKQDLCVNCNECSIARACPSNAFVRVPAHDPYLLKTRPKETPPPA